MLISKNCLNLIEKYLNNDKTMLEIGSGESTLYFSKKCKVLYSIEHSLIWYNKISDRIKFNKLNNIIYNHIPIENKKDVIKYVNKIDNNIKYDIIFIDGMCRTFCYLKAFEQLKDDGYLLIHDFYNTKISTGRLLSIYAPNNYNINNEYNIYEAWYPDLLFKYYREIESIKEYKNEKGNDIIILQKKKVDFEIKDLINLLNENNIN